MSSGFSAVRGFNPALRLGAAALAAALAGCQPSPSNDPAAAAANAPAAPAQAAPLADARLTLSNNGGAIHYSGRVDSEATRSAVVAALGQAYGSRGIAGSLDVDGNTRAPTWAAGLAPFLAAFTMQGAAVTFEGDRIELGGFVADEDRATLLKTTRTLFPGAELGGLFVGAEQAPAAAAAAANEAPLDTAALLAALNRMRIRFATDSAQIEGASLNDVIQAARRIKAVQGQARFAVIAHPEVSDQPDFDRDLAAQRAEAVKIQLVLNGVSPGAVETRVGEPASEDRPRIAFAAAE